MIGDDIAAALPELRAQAESLMTTPCEIREPGSRQYNPETDTEQYVPGALVWPPAGETGWCHIRQGNQPVVVVAGGQQVTEQGYLCTVPHDAVFNAGHILKITGGDDPYLVGRSLTIETIHGRTWRVQRRFLALDNLG